MLDISMKIIGGSYMVVAPYHMLTLLLLTPRPLLSCLRFLSFHHQRMMISNRSSRRTPLRPFLVMDDKEGEIVED